jgi:hypothetical protein
MPPWMSTLREPFLAMRAPNWSLEKCRIGLAMARHPANLSL